MLTINGRLLQAGVDETYKAFNSQQEETFKKLLDLFQKVESCSQEISISSSHFQKPLKMLVKKKGLYREIARQLKKGTGIDLSSGEPLPENSYCVTTAKDFSKKIKTLDQHIKGFLHRMYNSEEGVHRIMQLMNIAESYGLGWTCTIINHPESYFDEKFLKISLNSNSEYLFQVTFCGAVKYNVFEPFHACLKQKKAFKSEYNKLKVNVEGEGLSSNLLGQVHDIFESCNQHRNREAR